MLYKINLYAYRWLCMLFPDMKLPLPQPRTENIHLATSTFSTPWSPRTLNAEFFFLVSEKNTSLIGKPTDPLMFVKINSRDVLLHVILLNFTGKHGT